MNREGSMAALILAAGRSSRMGSFKPLLPLGKTTVIEEAVGRFLRAAVRDVRVVVGHNAEALIPLLDSQHVKWILNPDYQRGMLSSVRAGIEGLDAHTEALFVLPADVPLVKPRTIETLARAYREGRAAVVYPRFQGQRGHPPLLSTSCIQGLPVDLEGGLRAYLTRFEADALDVDVIDAAILMDCDTPEDHRRLQSYLARENIPTVRECEALWSRFNVSREVSAHSRLVAELAHALAVHLGLAGYRLDIPLIVAAGYLHDLMKGEPDHARAGAGALDALGYPQVAPLVASHMDIRLSGPFPTESQLIYLVDKLARGHRIVPLEERFQESLTRFADRQDIQEAVLKRLRNARVVKERIEAILRMPIERIIEKHAKGLQMAAQSRRRTIYLIRHGTIGLTEGGKRFIGQIDLPLSREGIRQAEALADGLRHIPFSAIFCSDLERSQATAEIIARPHGLPITVRKDLREISLGDWEGLSFDEVRRCHGRDFEERGRDIAHFRPPGGESFMDCACRVAPALFEMLKSTQGHILVAGHAGVNRILLCQAQGHPLGNLLQIPQAYGCLSLLDYEDYTLEMRVLNTTHHLPDLSAPCC